MTLRQSLQGSQRIHHLQEVCLRITLVGFYRHVFNYEVPYPSAIEVIDIPMTIVSFCFQREEQGFLWETERTAVSEKPPDLSLPTAIASGSYQGGHLFNRICHEYCLY